MTTREERALITLRNLAKRWPKHLWIYVADGQLCVMRKGEDGERLMQPNGGFDQDAIVDIINIEADGGDW